MNVDNIEAGWKAALAAEFEEPYMLKLDAFLAAEKAKKKTIYPSDRDWFNALRFTPLNQVKVVILGQDPYHGPDQAHGLAFSVKPSSKVPPSLVNIYKELESDLGIPRAKHGYLESWANQGVLLLNAVLTVEMSKAASHQKQGWEQFTDHIIHIINEQCKGVVFMLWGSYAQKKCIFINKNSHLVLESAHPSPLSAHRGFLGCRHFSQVNSYLQQQGKTAINWQLPDQVLDVDGSPRFELIG